MEQAGREAANGKRRECEMAARITGQLSHSMKHLQCVLSVFPGLDLLGRGFRAEGFSVVRSPDLIWGEDVRGWHVSPGRFDGVIGGSPCQDFSQARRSEPTGKGVELLAEFVRIVEEAKPKWFLLENVPRVPDVRVAGFERVQRFDLRATECGGVQNRLRHFQFGDWRGRQLHLRRLPRVMATAKTVLATDYKKDRGRTFADVCKLQGLPRDFDLPNWSKRFKYQAVGNGVFIPMAQMIARAIAEIGLDHPPLCICGCGREINGKQQSATAACRKRVQLRKGKYDD